MKKNVIPAEAGIHAFPLARCLIWIPAFAGMTAILLSSCAHKAPLKTPSQIEKAEKKAQAKAAREAKQKAKEESKSSTPAATEDNQVSVP